MSTHKKPDVPFYKSLSLQGIDNIVIKGKVPHKAERFNVWLQKGAEAEPKIVALVFDARFNYGESKNIIVCNDRRCGYWGSEERNAKTFPFAYGEKFKLEIQLHTNKYTILINGSAIKDFNHRMSIQEVDTLRIDGNVELDEVKIETILD